MYRHLILLPLLALLAPACTSAPEVDPDIARQAGEAARAVADTDHADTLALQRAIVDARVRHDRLLLTGDQAAAQAFEQAFADSLKAYDPKLSNEIFPPEK